MDIAGILRHLNTLLAREKGVRSRARENRASSIVLKDFVSTLHLKFELLARLYSSTVSPLHMVPTAQLVDKLWHTRHQHKKNTSSLRLRHLKLALEAVSVLSLQDVLSLYRMCSLSI